MLTPTEQVIVGARASVRRADYGSEYTHQEQRKRKRSNNKKKSNNKKTKAN
jgi:hypothetical protein